MATFERVGAVNLGAKAASDSELVIYVEDDADNWRVTRARLRRRFRLVWARTSKEACELIKTHREKIFAILMDIELKGSELDGIQLTRLIRGTLAREDVPAYARDVPMLERVPILFVTAYGPQYPEIELVAAGGNRRLTKPVDFAELSLSLSLLDVEQLSSLAIQIVKLATTPGATPEALWARAERDPLFSARMRALITTGLLGETSTQTLAHLRNLALVIVLVSLVRENRSSSDLIALCIRRAVAAAAIARHRCPELISDSFAMGMLLDAGLVTRARHDLAGVTELVAVSAGERIVRECAAGEPEHPLLGAKLAASWGLSRSIQEAVRYHHSPHDFDSMLGIAWAAERAAALFEGGDVGGNWSDAHQALKQIGLSREQAEVVLAEIPGAVDVATVALGRPAGRQRTVDELLQPSAINEELSRSYRGAVHALGIVGTEKLELIRSQREVNDELVAARDRERSIRAAIQRFFLPQKTESAFASFELCAFHRAAEECGGDWWWCDPLGEDPSVFVGDATGRGVEAAMVTASLVSSFRLFRKMSPGASIDQTLRALHEELCETTSGQRAMTMSVVRHDPAGRTLHWWSAAAPRILISRADGRLDEMVARGTPLGSNGTLVLGHVEIPVGPRDRVLLFTDGVPEAKTRNDGRIGLRHAADLFAGTRTQSAADALNSIIDGIDHGRGGSPQEDDMTLVLLEIRDIR